MKNKKTALLKSGLAMLLALSMLVGSTFAWFTDSVTSKGNVITAGKLDVEMYWTDDLNSGVWHNVEEDGYNTIFNYDKWEPGYTDVKYIKLVNNGNLALNYKLTLTPENGVGKLAEVINVYFADEAVEMNGREDLDKLGAIGLLNNVLDGGATANGTLLAEGQQSPLHPTKETVMTFAMTMITTAGNEYQEEDAGDFTITALATQAAFEKDSFGSNYDGSAEYPQIISGGSVTATFNPDNGKVPAGGVNLQGDGIAAYAPAGVALKNGADSLKLSVTPLKNTTSDITVVNNEILIPVDVHIDGVAEDNTTPIIVDLGEVLPKYLNMGNYHLYHVEDGVNSVMTLVNSRDALTAHNTYTYDPMTGAVSVAMASFSEVALVADTAKGWKRTIATGFGGGTGTAADPYLIANADQFAYFNECISNDNDEYAGAHYKLLSDINIDGAEDGGKFYPIGYRKEGGAIATFALGDAPEAIYEINEDTKLPANVMADIDKVWYTYGGAFKGVFDGNGHKISNIYQNTWALKGNYDGNYWNAAMGVFGYVYDGTIKNLTVDNFESDGEFTPTGVIAAYAAGNAKFENIAITHCNPRVYNTGNGGIIGIAGNTSAANDDHITLKNITVDDSNKITALWGSWDVACGGLVGMYRGNVDSNGNATGDTISFENCHVAAQIDVFNDVCANYQYYAYRYSGMIIGSVRHNATEGGKTVPNTAGIAASGCTVNFGAWNEYYYCEFEKNTMASYSEDYQFSRVDKSEIIFENNKAVGCTHDHTDAEDKRAVFLPFYQLFTGYSWGVSSVGLKDYGGVETTLDILKGNESSSADKFDKADNAPETYRPGMTYTVGNLFEAIDGPVDIVDSTVSVFISPATESDKVSGTYNANTTDWTQGTITFADNCEGSANIIITDYYFCNVFVLTLNAEKSVQKFNAKDVTSQNAYSLISLGDLFTATNVNKAVNATVTDPDGNRQAISANANDWMNKTILLTKDGTWTVNIKEDDEYCEATDITINVNQSDIFESKFAGDFLYRVGNENAVEWNSLFNAKYANPVDVFVQIENVKGDANGTYSNGSIKFSGTGVVKVTIAAVGANTAELQLEVVNATNVAENGTISNYAVSSVLLGNTTVSTLYLNGGATLYGNGFTIDCKNSPVSGTGNVSGNYIIGLAGANLDNVVVIGKVYTQYGAMASDNYNRALIISTGNSTITNCHLANTAAPVRINSGSLTIKGSTLKGGNFANIDVRSGHLILDNVTTINQSLGNDKADDGSSVVGLGIVVYYETVNVSATSITVKNGLTQHNNISSNDEFSNTYAKQFVNGMFDDSTSSLQHVDGGVKWVNTGIILMTTGVNVTGAGNKSDVSFMGATGSVYTTVPTAASVAKVPAEYTTLGQGVLAPIASFDHDNASKGNYIPKEAEKNDYCYYDGEKVQISMDKGDTFQYDPFILNAAKLGEELSYTVKLNGNDVSKGSKISFNTAGEYTITYTYNDPYNYTIGENGALESFTVTYTKTDVVTVATVEPKAVHATFTFVKDNNNTGTEEILYSNNTYISAKGVTANGTDWGKITVGDKTIVYPIVTANVKTSNKECQVFYYVFRNVLSITDADGNTKYDENTGTDGKMPSNLKVVKGNELKVENNVFINYNDSNLSRTAGKIFCYSSSSQEDSPVKYNGYLAYKSPSGLKFNSSTRNYDAAVIVQYQFTDSNNATYYYYVGYKINNPNNGATGDQESSGGGCVTPDTLITLADGSQVRVDSLKGDEMLLAWNLETGKYEAAPIVFVDSEEEKAYEIIHLYFSDGSDVKVIDEHGFFDLDLGKYVYIDAENYAEYIGHRFVAEGDIAANDWNVITLDDVVIETEVTTAWSPVTFGHLCYYTNGVLSMPGGIDGLFNIFEVDTDTMQYDVEKMQQDIETYGLFTLDDFGGMIPEVAFEAFNGDYLKVAIGKGLITWEDIARLAERYVPLV